MPTTILGIITGLAIMIFAIIQVSQQDPSRVVTLTDMYLNLPAFLIVVGGTLAATLIAHPFSHLVRGFTAFFIVFKRREFDFIQRIEEICSFSEAYIQKGVPGIEEKLKNYNSENLLKDAMTMIVNGYQFEEIKEYIQTSIQRRYDREMIDYYVFRTMARAAPAFGMVGTLVGLIFMLRVMSESPERMGPFLAVALVTTFYGLLLAHLIFAPMGNKLLHQAELNLRIGTMECAGIEYILKKQHPVYIKDHLSSYVPPRQRKRLLKIEEKKGKK